MLLQFGHRGMPVESQVQALEALELADIRSWNGLHDFIEVVPLQLKKGSYIFEYGGKKLSFNVTGKKKQIIPLIL